jgi:hypothetical protein
MIVFDLICKDQHRFEGWFASGEDFTSQKSRGLLACPVCGGAHVEKLPAAKIRKQSEPAVPAAASAVQAGKTEQVDVSRIIDYILTHSEDVGKSFAEEARKIHYQETPQRSIRGVASRAEAEDLREEGIPVFSLPIPPQDRWN